MPPSRPSRAKKEVEESAPLYADDDSGGDTDHDEQPTPKPQRTLSKKRLSDVYDTSLNMDSGRPPLKSVSLNDDAAEKRRRRKSAKVSLMPMEEGEAGPSGEGAAEQDPARPTAHGRQKQLPAVEEAPRIQVSLDVMNSNFEEWMKMATDNKINANNSWNVALIDYFHDMSLLRNNADNSINFQRASFTLDGCVKIWTSRVDSVGTETGKLLSNLANEGRVGEDDGDNDEEGGEEGGSQQNKKKKTHRPASTLARDAAQLRSKKLDLGFRVDPLFRKTCADFDEGGAQGLLMNHLSLGVVSDGSLRVVFDASDSIAKDGEEEDSLEEPPDEVNLTEIRKNYLPNLEDLEDKAICHSLDGFSFSKDAFAMDDLTMFRDDIAGVDTWDDDDGNEPAGFNDDGALAQPMDVDGAEEDFFVGDQAVHDDYVDQLDSPSAGSDHAEGREEGGSGGGGAPVPFDPRRAGPNENDLFVAPTEGDGEGGLMFDYFDHSKMKNWAGPEHWKLRKVVRRPVDTAEAPTKRREKKEAFKIDFLTPSDKSIKDIAKELFAPVTKGAGITLPNSNTASRRGKGRKGKEREREDKRFDNTLPDDMHFSSRQLVTLFLKPKFSLKMRGQRARLEDRADGEIDENFWAQAAADQAAGRADEDDIDQTQGGGAIPFNTQFFQDDYDDTGGFDDGGDMGGDAETEQELLSSAQGATRRVRPEFVNYAKRAKRVDVRKLKENIWKNLDIVVPEEGEEAMETDDRAPTDPSEPRVFENVIGGLKKSYPRDKMEEISTSFCFICLLHLANERGLKLESSADGIEPMEEEGEKKIGNIWDLKVYRDPDATPAA